MRRHDRAVAIGLVASVALAVVLFALIMFLGSSVPQWVYVLLGVVLFTVVINMLEDVYEDLRQRRLPTEPGRMITGAMIGRAYADRVPLRRLALSTPIIGHDPFSGGDLGYFTHYRVCANDVLVLRFAPPDRVHSYLLYWSDRDADWTDKLPGRYRMGDYAKPTPRALRLSQRLMRRLARDRGIDPRMRPCTLQVYGDRARIILPPNVPELETGAQDPNIGTRIDGVAILTDTFRRHR
ncbi:hypothetical protein JS528_00845 [Bifidobacterium sp. MA2]|uniref:Uncharacterized protein n=1 Tax=Bifidobacterium santillanense TaxID=2809028 RepID=A0ABS5UM05_9BIFI|nr:hypothetical protein [Bifidobacterium santillanense]MBT1171929.1 hypothetical protein [Bifidobacterium santillanense]